MADYHIRVPQVVHETVDGEVVAIDFTTGSYYSLRGPAEAVWAALAADGGADRVDIVQRVASRYQADDLAERVSAFLSRLVDEGLLERRSDNGEGAVHGVGDGDGGEPLGDLAFEKFTDMEEIILLDPVHDVSEAGWPNAPA